MNRACFSRFVTSVPPIAFVIALGVFTGEASAQTTSSFANFESSQINPIRITADGTRLFAVNTPNGTVSVFSLATPTAPKLIAEIPVGVEPVSVNPLTDDQAWVVNEVSETVSVVSVSRGIVIATIQAPLEPHDVVFAGGLAYISCSRTNLIAVVNTTTFALQSTIPVFGGSPRALAVSANGSKVYAAMAISGNATTLIPSNLAPAQSAPTNPDLPTPPQVGLIVSATDPNWISDINYSMPDYDVAVIATGSTPSLVGYYSGIGTINLGMAVNPTTGDIYVSNTDALNLVHFETNLLGHFVNNRITKIQVSTGQITPYDLNSGLNYSLLPNTAALATSIAQPAGVVFNPNGQSMWVASFGTDRVAQVDTSGNVLTRIEVAQASGAGSNVDPIHKKGPRGLALTSNAQTLYVLNRISNTISVINTSSQKVTSEIEIGYNPTPTAILQGRGFLYDAKLSGNGTGSCASCHVDGDMDHLAWDLGDPAGNMTSTNQNGLAISFHPMKGPMTTLTLKGLSNLSPYHWRGEQPNFAAFNSTFSSLMGSSQLSTANMTLYTNFVNTILFQPNPHLNLDGSFPSSIEGGNPAAGLSDFVNLALTQISSTAQTCNACHTASPSGPGTNRLIIPQNGTGQPMKTPEIRNAYQKLLRAPVITASGGLAVIDGFGMDHDGHVGDLSDFFAASIFSLYTSQEKTDMTAYLLCFDTGTAPAVGYTQTLTKTNVSVYATVWSTLQSQAAAGKIDLEVRGTVNGVVHGLLYKPSSNTYQLDTGSTTYTQAQLQTLITNGDTLSIMGVYPGTGSAAVGTIL